jgi:aromatic-L-amino-acid/L-tryptophan decarboxylase
MRESAAMISHPSPLPTLQATAEHPLEPSSAEMRGMVEAALARVVAHIESLPAQPAFATEGAVALARSLVEPLPEEGTPFPALLDLLFERAIPATFNAAGPGYLAYIPGGGLFHAAVADLIADAVNRYTGVFAAAPALSQLEANVVAWLAEIVGYPREARGFLTSGGSLANWSALVTARRERLPEDFLRGTLYASGETHHSVQKAALLAGFPPANVREVPVDERFRVVPEALKALIEEDRRQGFTPFLVVGNAGTTNTGAVDPLDELADLAQSQELWFHVDAAYGGFFLLTAEGRQVMRGVERADSVVLDPHKGLFLPYGTGALLVKDGAALKRAHALTADYMPPLQEDPDLVDFCEISPELSKPYRGLRVWLPVKLLGIGPFRAALEEKLALTRWATEELRATPGIEILAEPQLSVVAFRLHPEEWQGLPAAEVNRRNRRLLDRVNARKRVFLTSTLLGDRFALRICVVSFRTHQDRMEACMEDLRAAVKEVLAGG